MSAPRKPAAFRIDPPAVEQETAAPRAARPPRAIQAERVVVTPAEIDVFEQAEADDAIPPPPVPVRRGWSLGAIFGGAVGVLVSLALGVWVDALIRDLFERATWLGWAAGAVAVIAALALVGIVAREIAALARLASVERLRADAEDAFARNDPRAARAVIASLTTIVSSRPETAAGRRAMAATQDEVVDGADLVRLAETELLAPLDMQARTLILDAAKRVSIVTAVSPRAILDLAYVAFEASRLVRRLGTLYGGRPGTLGFFRLVRSVLAHLAVTGAIAAGDDFVHQIVGQGLAARLSAKLGEGVVNGMMTARIGMAAMAATRPLPFVAVQPPRLSDFLGVLTRFGRDRAGTAPRDPA